MALCLGIQDTNDKEMCKQSWKAYTQQSDSVQNLDKNTKKFIKKTEKMVVDTTGDKVWLVTYSGVKLFIEKKYEIKLKGYVSDYTKLTYDDNLYLLSIGWDL